MKAVIWAPLGGVLQKGCPVTSREFEALTLSQTMDAER